MEIVWKSLEDLCRRVSELLRAALADGQSNRLDTDSSAAVRAIASPIKVETDSTRILRAPRTASVGWIESVITSSFRFDDAMRATAPPESTP